MNPLISILIPCYNAAPWIAETVASIRAQTWRRYEIIVINDGSTDDSRKIIEGLAGPDLKVVDQANAGQSAAFNRGLALAQGDFIEYLDADDLLAPEKFQRQIERLQQLPPGWVATGAWARFTRDPAEAHFHSEPIWRDLSPVDWLITSWQGGGMMHGASWLAPRTVVKAAGPWDERLSLINDFDYFSRLVLASEGIAFCPQARTYYRSNLGQSVSATTSRRGWESAFLSTHLGTAALLVREDSPRTRQAAAVNLQRMACNAYPFAPDLVAQAEKKIAALGGAPVKLGGGPVIQLLRRTCGWKFARRAQVAGRRVVYGLRS